MSIFFDILKLLLVAVIGGIILKLVTEGKKGAVAVADAVTELKDSAVNLVSPNRVSPLGNPVSRFFGSLFKSDAEKEVDRIFSPENKGLPAPANAVKPWEAVTPSGATQGPWGSAATTNPAPGPRTTVGVITKPAVYQSIPRRATNTGESSAARNPNPPITNPEIFRPQDITGIMVP